MTASLTLLAPNGFPNVNANTDLVSEIVRATNEMSAPNGVRGLIDGDIIVISSKVVAKAEGRVVPESQRVNQIAAQTKEVIAEKDATKIVRNLHGLVLAAAGVDASNTEPGTVVLLPENPDDSAARIRKSLQDELGLRLGVIVSDTLGRPWRLGLTDAAIGSAGVVVLEDHRGRLDAYGRSLELTQIAIGDELAAAADLLKSKANQRPLAVVRGLSHLVGDDCDQSGQTLIRPLDEDLFPLGTREALAKGASEAAQTRRTIRQFDPAPIDPKELSDLLTHATAAAITAPAPHHTQPWRFVHVSAEMKPKLLSAMEERWRRDLSDLDALTSDQIEKRVARGQLLHDAPALVVPCLTREGAHRYPDDRRAAAERDMFTLSAGAAIENFLIYVSAQGWGSAWVSSSIFCPADVCKTLQIPEEWQPLGVIAIGKAASAPAPRKGSNVRDFIIHR